MDRKFQPGIAILLLQILSSIFAKKSIAARETLTKAFIQYFQNQGHLEGSALIKARFDHSINHNIPLEDIARFECGSAVAALSNTSPACFWLVYHLYSNDRILEECREELTRLVSNVSFVTEDGVAKAVRTLDLTNIKATCPILSSTFQEVLRMHSVGVSARLVMQDHLLDGRYLLKKGGIVMIPGPVQHTSSAAFGPSVESFDHRRFLPGEQMPNPVAFRAFGGGTTQCPGRHFATTEILAFAALMVLRCDVKPASGKWVCPTTHGAGSWEITPMPDFDIDVTITPRSGAEKSEWKVVITDSDKRSTSSAENM